jgi:hypothetical protein
MLSVQLLPFSHTRSAPLPQTASRRKRAGVEPTQDCFAAPTGFEVRPAHRDRFSSIATMAVSLRLGKLRRETGFFRRFQATAIQPDTILGDPPDHRAG